MGNEIEISSSLNLNEKNPELEKRLDKDFVEPNENNQNMQEC